MEKKEALEIIRIALTGYIEDSAGAESEEAKYIDEAFGIMKKEPDNFYYQIRYKSPVGECDYFILDNQQYENDEFWEYDPNNLQETEEVMREASDEMGVDMWIVKISEENISNT